MFRVAAMTRIVEFIRKEYEGNQQHGRLEKLELRVRLQNREVEWFGQEMVDRSAIAMENVSGIGF